MRRRQFIKNGTLLSTGLLVFPKRYTAPSEADSSIEIILDEPIGTIAPEVYGHFTEHIGGLVYDGIWVGKDSKIPNINGIRKELVDHMLQLNPGSLRWPGGCFADSYNWKDGIGPMDQRPRRSNFWINTPFMQNAPAGPTKYDPNHFGTDEFLQFCELIGTKPYLAANARTLSPQDFMDWVEYCNAPAGTTSYGDQRVANGHKDPYQVSYWGVGNESWGCGGDMLPENYADTYRRFTSFLPQFGLDLQLVGVGPSDSWESRDIEWTRRLFTRLAEKSPGFAAHRMDGYSLHFYCGSTGNSSIDYTDEDWYELLWRSDQMEKIITEHWNVMGAFDFDRKIKLYIDEWGAWHPQKTEVHNTHLFGQTSTMRDALIAALTLDTFNRHADKVVMGNIAQLINNLQSLFLAHEERFVVTPNFYVFKMYKEHQQGVALRTEFSAPASDSERKLWGLAGSASRKENQVFLTVVNPSITTPRETEIIIHGAKIKKATASIFKNSDIRAYNDLENPNGVEPPTHGSVYVKQGKAVHLIPPASVCAFYLEM